METFVVLGFTINTLTLFALVLAIGMVVDDAIVVIENVEEHMAKDHMPVKESTEKAMDEVQGPIIATTAVLAAIFVPVAFLGGTMGVLYKFEFLFRPVYPATPYPESVSRIKHIVENFLGYRFIVVFFNTSSGQ